MTNLEKIVTIDHMQHFIRDLESRLKAQGKTPSFEDLKNGLLNELEDFLIYDLNKSVRLLKAIEQWKKGEAKK